MHHKALRVRSRLVTQWKPNIIQLNAVNYQQGGICAV